MNRQKIDKLYYYSGNFYLSKVETFLKKDIYHKRTIGLVSTKLKSFEIDDELDFFIVDKIMKYYKKIIKLK